MALAYSPIVRDSATTRNATAAGDRSKHGRSVSPWPNRNQSYDPEIVRSGVTVALEARALTHRAIYYDTTLIGTSRHGTSLYRYT